MEMDIEKIAADALEVAPVYYKPTGNKAAVDLVRRCSSDDVQCKDSKYTNLKDLVNVADETKAVLSGNTITDINSKFRLAAAANNLMVNNMRYNVIENNISHLVANIKIDLCEIIYEYLAQYNTCDVPGSIIGGLLFTTIDRDGSTITLLDRTMRFLTGEIITHIVFYPDTCELERKMLTNNLTSNIESFIKSALSNCVLGERYAGMMYGPVNTAHSKNYRDDTLYIESNAQKLRKTYNDIYKIITAYFSSDMYSELLEATVDNIVRMAKELSSASNAVFDLESELHEEFNKGEENNEKE